MYKLVLSALSAWKDVTVREEVEKMKDLMKLNVSNRYFASSFLYNYIGMIVQYIDAITSLNC